MGDNIKTVAVLGAGVIGGSWAALFLSKGLKVLLSDPAPGAKGGFEAYLDAAWTTLEALGLPDGASKTNYEMVDSLLPYLNEVDFIQENGPEHRDLKTKLIAELDAHARPEVIIASSSSGLPASQFVTECKKAPQRVLVAHPFNPPHIVPLVEVVPHPGTSQQSINTALAFYRGLGKVPVMINHEVPGFVANRLQAAVNNEAYSLVSRGVVSARDMDTIVTTGPGPRWAIHGPIVTNTLGGGGGKDGFSQRLERLGRGIRVWEEDILVHRFMWTEDEQNLLKEQVGQYLDQIDLPKIVAQRDQVLLRIMREKHKSNSLV